jgi:hypothetical protein
MRSATLARTHLAIIQRWLVAPLLAGEKRIESRFMRQKHLPYGRIAAGDRIYFKAAGGQVIGLYKAVRVMQFERLSPAAVLALRRRYDHAIRAGAGYWRARRDCRYGVLIWLGRMKNVAGLAAPPRQYGSGWMILAE